MLEKRRAPWIRELFAGRFYQCLAVSFCLLLGLAMIANNQLAGEAMWFWYARLFHSGSRLYADLHLALQPLYVLEMDVWMNLFGTKLLVTEIPSLIHLLVFCLGLYLLLRQSDWPDWQKAVVIVSCFVFWIAGPSYRFDDYHVTTESFVLYSLLLLLLIAKTDVVQRQVALALALGILCGFTATSRLNDGAALFASTSICLLVLARKRKFMVTGLFVAVSVLTLLMVVRCTGDTFSGYLANTLTRAVGSKGGTGTILANPYHFFINAERMRHGVKWLFRAIVALAAAGALMQRYWKKNVWAITAVQMALAPAAFAFASHFDQQKLLSFSGDGGIFWGAFTDLAVCLIVVATCALSILVLVRLVVWIFSSGKFEWDAREILVLYPLAQITSISATAAAEPHSGYNSSMALLLLLVPLLQPYRKQVAWANATFLTFLISIAVTGTILKVHTPYFWENIRGRPMFVDRQWYRHPVYGPMYVQSDWLQLNTSICADMGGIGSHPELLSLPYSYSNYFCDSPPWHGYVETFIDTTQRSTMENLQVDLQTSPPQWIVYQQQLGSLYVLEQLFSHGRPSPQRDLDQLITQKLATGQWKVVDFKRIQYGDGWYVIRTQP
jgi:hypothetical protein